MTDPELSLLWIGTGRGGPMPRGQNDIAIAFLEQSPKARDAAIEAEKDRQRRELRRTRQVAAVLGAAFLFAAGFVGSL